MRKTQAETMVLIASLVVPCIAVGCTIDSSSSAATASTASALWTGDTGIGGSPGSDLAITSWGPGRFDLFYARGGHLIHRWSQGSWSPEEDLGGDIASAPAAVSWGPNRIDVFAMSRTNRLAHLWWDGAWHPWELLGGIVTSAPAVTSWAPGRLDVFYANFNSALGHIYYDQGWSAHEQLGSEIIVGAPGAVSWSAGRIDVFARQQASGGPLRHKWFSGGWSGWESLGGNVASAPSVASWGQNRLDVFYLGPDAALKTQTWDGAWHPEASLGGSYSGAPSAIALPSKEIDVYLPQASLGVAERRWLPPTIQATLSSDAQPTTSTTWKTYAVYPGQPVHVSWSITSSQCDRISWSGAYSIGSSSFSFVQGQTTSSSASGVATVTAPSKDTVLVLNASCFVGSGPSVALSSPTILLRPTLSPPAICYPWLPGANFAQLHNEDPSDTMAVWMTDNDTGTFTLAGSIPPWDTIQVTLPNCHAVSFTAYSEACAAAAGGDATTNPKALPDGCRKWDSSPIVGRTDGSTTFLQW